MECSRCLYYSPSDEDPHTGECRRHPPVVFDRPGQWVERMSVWPDVNWLNWCGEFKYDPDGPIVS